MSETSGSLQEVKAAIERYESFLVTAHVHPDGDSVGSVVAMGWLLERLGKRAVLAMEDPVPGAYAFLPGSASVIVDPGPVDVDAIIVLDCGDPERTGAISSHLRPGRPVINIDHHRQNEFPSPKYCRTEAAATGELIYELIGAFDVPLDAAAATSIYTALLTDTGSFRFANTTERTLRIAGDLLSKGVSPGFVAEQVYEVKPLGSVRLLAAVLSTLQVSECGRVAWLSVTAETLRHCGVDSSETEGFVNYARMISGVAIGLLFREVSESMTKVSWRSRDQHDVSRLAARFGGGGHLNAAGCEIASPIDDAIRAAVAVALQSLDAEQLPAHGLRTGAD